MRARWVRRVVLGMVLIAGTATLVAVPATADDVPAGLERFYHQGLDWKPCNDKALDDAGAQCSTVVVPLDYARPDARTTTVALSRIPATDPARRRGIMLSNPGGPGGPGLNMMVTVKDRLTPDVRAQYDLIGMDPRGIGRSDRMNCAIPLPTMLFSAGFDLFGYARDTTLAAALATSCVAPDPEKARSTTTRNIARDMDVIRGAFGERTMNYYGGSYGTYLGAVYMQMFGAHADRFVLDSAVDPERYWLGMFQDMGPINEYALDDWARWAARHDADYHFGGTAPQVRAYVEDLVHRAAAHPVVKDLYLLDEHTVPMMLFALLVNPKFNADLADVLGIIDDGVSGRFTDMQRLKSKITGAVPTEVPGMAGIMCGDKAAPRDPAWYYRNIDAVRATQPVFGAFANNITACAYWPDPVEPPTDVHNSVPALILATVHDTRTAYPEGLALHEDLTGSRLVTLADTRIHGAFRVGLSPCVSDKVNTYFADGTLPAADTTCEPDPSYFPE
ncbi:pimeloyl-ACP methyl ester carboxylesterase [Nocardia transvalensis]|uniref:Pimeloyl-ACP methyl ester carboxylesterase n=1 Tax=Nocardia transvalensis TaxID=37333 RepID=A0A7W9UI62_9NOCA|nr:alpha/beta fold hydrolase [Nocardia transvalensis]MBB5914073.1 pimeloyl-ACP methyl ester carboxylesterase [Nocardia transvalensis]